MGQADLPCARGVTHARVFIKLGWELRSAGNHIILTKPGTPVHLSIPNHDQVSKALLQKQIRRAGLTDQEYRKVFDSL